MLKRLIGSNKVLMYVGATLLTILAAQQFAIAQKSKKIENLNQDIGTLKIHVASKETAISSLTMANSELWVTVDSLKESSQACYGKLTEYQTLEKKYAQERIDRAKQIESLQAELDSYPDWSNVAIPDSLQRKAPDNN